MLVGIVAGSADFLDKPFLSLLIFSIDLRGRVTQREGKIQREDIFHLLFQSPGGHNIQAKGGQVKPGVRNFIWISHTGDRDSGAGAIICCLPGILAGN